MRRPPRWAWLVVIVFVPLCLSSCFIVTHALPYAIVYAPSSEEQINPKDDPDASALSELGVSSHVRVDVGPPDASAS